MKKNEIAEVKTGGEVALPSNWQEELAGAAKQSAANVRPTSSSIRMKSGILTYQDVAVPNNALDVIVIAFAQEHTFYKDKWDADNPSNPDCFAVVESSVEMQDIIPSSAVDDPQAESCGECPMLEWGSSLTGGRGKACQQRYRLLCIPAGAMNSADEVLSAEVATLKLAVTSGKVWSQYLQTITALHQRPEWAVVTTIGAKPDPKTQFKATFEVAQAIDFAAHPELYQAIQKKREMSQSTLLLGYDMSSGEEKAAPKTSKADA